MDDADLERLVVKPGKLNPKFSRNVTQYTLVLNSGIKEIKIDPLTRDSNASWTIPGIGPERVIAICEGKSFTCTVEVTAEDGNIKNYNIDITSLSSSSAVLSSLKIQGFQLTPYFDSHVYTYECLVPFYVNNVVIEALSPDKKSVVNIPGSDSNSVILNVGILKINIVVTSADGSASQSYDIFVRRNRFIYPIMHPHYNCKICQTILHCPVSIQNGGSTYYCESCLNCVTRTNNRNPATGEKLTNNFLIQEIEVDNQLSGEMINCPFQCGLSLPVRDLGNHVRNSCSMGLIYAEKIDCVFLNKAKQDNSLMETQSCPSCSRPVLTLENSFHQQVCSSKVNYSIDHKVKINQWQTKYQEKIIAQEVIRPMTDALECEKSYIQAVTERKYVIAMDYLEKACRLYAYAIHVNSKEDEAHFRLGVLLEEIHFVSDVFGVRPDVIGDQQISGNDDFEFQTAESMEDDIKALTTQRGFDKNSSTTDQLKALDEEYHFLLDQGQSEKADYIQKLYAFKQKRIHVLTHDVCSNYSDTFIGKALVKYLDACASCPNNAVYQMHAGKCYIQHGIFDEAVKRLQHALALKPTFTEAKFYLAMAVDASTVTLESKYLKFVEQGLCKYIYCQLNEINMKGTFAERFSAEENSMFIEGIYHYSKALNSDPDNGNLFKKCDLLCFISTLCFHAMSRLLNRGKIFAKLQLHAFQALCDYGKELLDTPYNKLKFWENLSMLAAQFGNTSLDMLKLRRQVCEATLMLFPNSNKALNRLGSVLYELQDFQSSSISLSEVEKYFRASLDVEERPVHQRDEVSKHLKDTEFWKKHQSGKDTPKIVSTDIGKGEDSKEKVKEKVTTPKKMLTTNKSTGKATVKSIPKPTVPKPTALKKKSHNAPMPKAAVKVSSRTSAAKKNGDPSLSCPKAKVNPTDSASSNELMEKNKGSGELNEKTVEARLGLARVLARNGRTENLVVVEGLYLEVIKMAPKLHDGYIELGEILADTKPMDAVDIYSQFLSSEETSFDDAYIFGEIVRLLLKCEEYDDPRLELNLISLGKVLGFSSLEKYVTILENKLKYHKLLCRVYAGINNRSIDDAELQAFFKFKLWV